jgi:hypothetical protein
MPVLERAPRKKIYCRFLAVQKTTWCQCKTQGIFKDINFRTEHDQNISLQKTGKTESSIRLRRRNRLQESSHESTKAHEATGSGLDVGGGASGVGAAATSASGARAASISTSTGRAAASGISAGRGGRGSKNNGGAVVGADGDGAGLVDHGASAGSSEGQSVDTRADSRNVGGERLRSDNSRLVGDGSGLVGNGGVNRRHASDDTQGVGLGEVGSLGSRVLGGRVLAAVLGLVGWAMAMSSCTYLSRSKGESHSGDEDGGAHSGGVCVCFCGGANEACWNDWIRR